MASTSPPSLVTATPTVAEDGLVTLLVPDGSVLVALLGDAGPAGRWAAASMSGATLAAPEFALFEAANIFRRQVISGRLDATQATLAHADLVDLPLQLWPYAPLSGRSWELRHNLTIYDASYVALAEMLGASVITLDTKLGDAPRPHRLLQTVACDAMIAATAVANGLPLYTVNPTDFAEIDGLDLRAVPHADH